MEVVSVNASNEEVMRYRVVSCDGNVGDVRVVLLFPEGMVGTLGPATKTHPLYCSMLVAELDPPYQTHRLNVRSGKYELD